METHPKILLLRQIERSLLLSPENRERLCAYLPLLTDSQVAELSVALSTEGEVMEVMTADALSDALERGDASSIQGFADFLHGATRDCSSAFEGSDAEEAEHLFDDQP